MRTLLLIAPLLLFAVACSDDSTQRATDTALSLEAATPPMPGKSKEIFRNYYQTEAIILIDGSQLEWQTQQRNRLGSYTKDDQGNLRLVLGQQVIYFTANEQGYFYTDPAGNKTTYFDESLRPAIQAEQNNLPNNESLMLEVKNNNYSNVENLLSKGANSNYRDPKNEDASPLYLACVNQNFEIAQLLLKKGADPKYGKKEWSSLHQVSFEGSSRIVKLLIDNDADVNLTYPGFRYPPLLAAVNSRRKNEVSDGVETVKLLLENGAKISYQIPKSKGRSIFAETVSDCSSTNLEDELKRRAILEMLHYKPNLDEQGWGHPLIDIIISLGRKGIGPEIQNKQISYIKIRYVAERLYKDPTIDVKSVVESWENLNADIDKYLRGQWKVLDPAEKIPAGAMLTFLNDKQIVRTTKDAARTSDFRRKGDVLQWIEFTGVINQISGSNLLLEGLGYDAGKTVRLIRVDTKSNSAGTGPSQCGTEPEQSGGAI